MLYGLCTLWRWKTVQHVGPSFTDELSLKKQNIVTEIWSRIRLLLMTATSLYCIYRLKSRQDVLTKACALWNSVAIATCFVVNGHMDWKAILREKSVKLWKLVCKKIKGLEPCDIHIISTQHPLFNLKDIRTLLSAWRSELIFKTYCEHRTNI